MKISCFSFRVRGIVAVDKTSTGSPVSKLPWQTVELGGWPGNCQVGTMLLMKGSLNDSEISWDKPVMS